MIHADLYLDQMDAGRYWPQNATVPFQEALRDIRAGKIRLEDYPFLSQQQARAFKLVLNIRDYLPEVPMLTVAQPVGAEAIPLNSPDGNSLVLVTGNNRFTVDVMTSIWAQGITPAYLLMVDCRGNTVDMAMIFGDFTAERLQQSLQKSRLGETVKHHHMIVPGLTSPLAGDFEKATGWQVEVGPVCAGELPLYLGSRWAFAS